MNKYIRKTIGTLIIAGAALGYYFSGGSTYHTVQKGESLWDIAKTEVVSKKEKDITDKINEFQIDPENSFIIPTKYRDHLVVKDGYLTEGHDKLTDRLRPGQQIRTGEKERNLAWLLGIIPGMMTVLYKKKDKKYQN